MARTTKVSVLVGLPPLVLALIALGRTMADCLAQVGLFSLAVLLVVTFFVVALWPSDTAILNRLIKDGKAVREEIIGRELDEAAANGVYKAWYERALKKIEARFPAYEDDFIVRDEPRPEGYSGQVTVIRLLVAKLGVLTEARKHQAG